MTPNRFGLLGITSLVDQADLGIIFSAIWVPIAQHLWIARRCGLSCCFWLDAFTRLLLGCFGRQVHGNSFRLEIKLGAIGAGSSCC